MMIFWVLFLLFIGVWLWVGLAPLFDGQPLQSTAREVLIRRCEEQHAAIMRGDTFYGVYGRYPPADL